MLTPWIACSTVFVETVPGQLRVPRWPHLYFGPNLYLLHSKRSSDDKTGRGDLIDLSFFTTESVCVWPGLVMNKTAPTGNAHMSWNDLNK